MTVSHAHARNACAHEQSTNIESGAVQWHKQSEQFLDCERECEREKVYCIVIASRRADLCHTASGASHQADNLAKLRHEHLSVLELIAQILGAVSSETSLMWLSAVRGMRIDVATMTTFSRKTALLPQTQ